MKKIIIAVLVSFILVQGFGQRENKVTTYSLAEYNKTIYDWTIGNNPWGIGLGFQTFFNNKTKFTPTIELTGDIYLADDKVLRLNTDGTIPTTDNDVPGMINIFAGSTFQPTESIYVSLVAGPSFINGQGLLGIKPSFGFYFSASKKWMGKVSYINIFNRDKATGEDFGSLSLAIGLKLF